MIKEIFFAFWFFASAGAANEAAFLSGKIPLLKSYSYPVDFKTKFRGKRVLGSNKTIRGFICGIIVSILIVYLQIYLQHKFTFIRTLNPLNYDRINPIIFGSLSGFGALLGDSVKSFFKRQVGISPGKSWFPFDQIDYILGGILFTSFYIKLGFLEYAALFLVWFLIHLLINAIGFLLKLKEDPL